MKPILQQKEKPARTTVQSGGVLRKIAKEILIKDIKTPKIKKVLKEMSESLKSQGDGVAIAAPQIGYSLRIFVVSGRIFTDHFEKDRKFRLENEEEKLLNQNNILKTKPKKEEVVPKDLVFINPKISKLSKDKEWMPEGCLSVRPLYGKTYRSNKALVTAYDEHGKKFTRGAAGLLAQIFQHETDHLNGILFIDHAKDVREELPQ